MHTLEITNDTADAMIRDILLQDYNTIVSSITELVLRETELEPHEAQDLADDRRFKAAFEIMMEYYFSDEQRQKAMKQ